MPLRRRRYDAIGDAEHDGLTRQQARVWGPFAGHGDVREARVAQQSPPAVPGGNTDGEMIAMLGCDASMCRAGIPQGGREGISAAISDRDSQMSLACSCDALLECECYSTYLRSQV